MLKITIQINDEEELAKSLVTRARAEIEAFEKYVRDEVNRQLRGDRHTYPCGTYKMGFYCRICEQRSRP